MEQNRGSISLIFDAFSSREPVPTSLENALERRLGGGARYHIPGDEQSADQRARQAGAGAPPGEGGDGGADGEQRHELDRDDGGKRHEAGIGQRVEQLSG